MSENELRPAPMIRGDREEFGHLFRWYELGFWHSTSGKPVIVVPPTAQSQSWFCVVPNNDQILEFTGDDVEKRIFAVAETFTRQVNLNDVRR